MLTAVDIAHHSLLGISCRHSERPNKPWSFFLSFYFSIIAQQMFAWADAWLLSSFLVLTGPSDGGASRYCFLHTLLSLIYTAFKNVP